jgi:hypothetical protein
VVGLHNGVRLTIHYAGQDAYSLRWQFEGGEAGIDTAPLHRGLTTFPHHYHAPDGQVLADPLTSPEHARGTTCEACCRRWRGVPGWT